MFDASLFAMKQRDNIDSFKERCYSMMNSKTWSYFDNETNTCYVLGLKFVLQELVSRYFEYFMKALEDVYIYPNSQFFD